MTYQEAIEWVDNFDFGKNGDDKYKANLWLQRVGENRGSAFTEHIARQFMKMLYELRMSIDEDYALSQEEDE